MAERFNDLARGLVGKALNTSQGELKSLLEFVEFNSDLLDLDRMSDHGYTQTVEWLRQLATLPRGTPFHLLWKARYLRARLGGIPRPRWHPILLAVDPSADQAGGLDQSPPSTGMRTISPYPRPARHPRNIR